MGRGSLEFLKAINAGFEDMGTHGQVMRLCILSCPGAALSAFVAPEGELAFDWTSIELKQRKYWNMNLKDSAWLS
jgi:hypothetical protein